MRKKQQNYSKTALMRNLNCIFIDLFLQIITQIKSHEGSNKRWAHKNKHDV